MAYFSNNFQNSIIYLGLKLGLTASSKESRLSSQSTRLVGERQLSFDKRIFNSHYDSRDELRWAISKRLTAPRVKLPTSTLISFSSIPRMFAATLTLMKSGVAAASFS